MGCWMYVNTLAFCASYLMDSGIIYQIVGAWICNRFYFKKILIGMIKHGFNWCRVWRLNIFPFSLFYTCFSFLLAYPFLEALATQSTNNSHHEKIITILERNAVFGNLVPLPNYSLVTISRSSLNVPRIIFILDFSLYFSLDIRLFSLQVVFVHWGYFKRFHTQYGLLIFGIRITDPEVKKWWKRQQEV